MAVRIPGLEVNPGRDWVGQFVGDPGTASLIRTIFVIIYRRIRLLVEYYSNNRSEVFELKLEI